MPAILLSLLLFSPPARSAEAPARRLNVVVIDMCSARADHFGAYGYPKSPTPGIDAVAKESVVFERAMAQSSWCLSNYATLFTGHTPEVHGVYAIAPRKIPENQFTVAQKLKEAGYDTAAFAGGGTWLLPAWGMDKGFDKYDDNGSSTSKRLSFAEQTPRILSWLKSRGGHPFFLYASVEDLHGPKNVSIKYSPDPMLDEEPVAFGLDASRPPLLRSSEAPAADGSGSEAPLAVKPFHARYEAQPEHVKVYDASLAEADRSISRFIRELKAMGVWDNTMLVITGDHGEMLGERGIEGHMEGLYEPILHVPLIVRHPGFPKLAGTRNGELVERVDLAPTILEAAGVSGAGMELQGRSLVTLLKDPRAPWREYAFAASKRSTDIARDFLLDERVVRGKRWKLHWYLYKGRYELYDLANDPGEDKDLSQQRPDMVQRLSFEMLKNLETTRPHVPGLPSGLGTRDGGSLLFPVPLD